MLLKMANSGKDWNQISKKLGGKGEEVCIRRLSKLKKKEKNWPREKELKIKHMFEVEGKSWIEIQRHFPGNSLTIQIIQPSKSGRDTKISSKLVRIKRIGLWKRIR